MRRRYVTNISLSAIVLILFLAPVAGAEEAKCTCDELRMNYATNKPECIVYLDVKDQPAEEAGSGSEGWTVEKSKITNEWISANGNALSITESDTEKWREHCDYWLESLNKSKRDKEVDLYAGIATAFCTRYNSALLEEIREKIK